MGKIDPVEAKAVQWAQDKINSLEAQAAQGDVAAGVEADFLKSKVELAKRDLHFDGSNLFGKAVDSFEVVVHHPVQAALGLGIFAAGAALPGPGAIVKLGSAAAGLGVTWASSNLWEAHHDSAAVEELVKLSQADKAASAPVNPAPATSTAPAAATAAPASANSGDEAEANPGSDAGMEWAGV
jgi:hypothetical protein